MPVRRVVAHEQVEADRGRVALQRGPIVYAAEWPDNPNGKVRNIVLPDSAALTSEFRADLLNGVQVDRRHGRRALASTRRARCTKSEQPFVAIPYATWANRGRGQMAVWLARTERSRGRRRSRRSRRRARSRPRRRRKIVAQHHRRRGAARDRTTRPRTSTGGRAVAASAGAQPAAPAGEGQQPCSRERMGRDGVRQAGDRSRRSEVYWFDDTGRGGVRVPPSWRLLYKDGDTWKPVESATFGVARNAWNTVTFKPVTTSALRIELTMQPEMSAGVQEWKVK